MAEQTVEERVTTLTFTKTQMDFAVGQIAAMHIDCPFQRGVASKMMLEVLMGEKTTAEAVSRSLLSEEALIRYVDAAIIFLENIVVSLGRTAA
ncbi:hypothetical protein AAVH_15264 [Aphelenchoides avenae]|nr:hypothetical protein AAVH_15264 [Aphelenchus avenae]